MSRANLENVRARIACPECASRARLVAGQALLRDVLRSVRPYPLEGSGLASILNPIEIDGKRAWADFAAGGVVVFEEVLPSRDHFDFVAQHVEPWCRVLSTLSALRRDPGDSVGSALVRWVMAQAPAERQASFDALDRLALFWDMSRGAAMTVGRHPPIRSNEDAWAVVDALPPLGQSRQKLDGEMEDGMLTRLWELASGATIEGRERRERPPTLSDQELRALADRYVAESGGPWYAGVRMIGEPNGAWVQPLHRDGPTISAEGQPAFFIDRSDGLRVTPGSSDWQRAGYVLRQWLVVDEPGATRFLSGDWDADPAWRDAWVHAVLQGAHERYATLKVVFPANALPDDQLAVARPNDAPEGGPTAMRDAFGPFAAVFEPEDPGAPDHRSLLLPSEGADAVLERVREAAAAPQARRFVQTLFNDAHWWPGLVAGIAYLWDPEGRFDRRWLWQAIDGGNWATPQLVAIAFLTDQHFVRRARRRIEEGSVVRFAKLLSVEPYKVQKLGCEPERSGKLLASVLGIAPLSPGLKDWEAQWRADPRFAELLEEDAQRDRSDRIASSWLAAVVDLFARRGIAMVPAETMPRSVVSSLLGVVESWAWKVRRFLATADVRGD